MIVDPRLNKDYHSFLSSEVRESELLQTLDLYQEAFSIAMHCKRCRHKFRQYLKRKGIRWLN